MFKIHGLYKAITSIQANRKLWKEEIYICHEKFTEFVEDRKFNMRWDGGKNWEVLLEFGAKA